MWSFGYTDHFAPEGPIDVFWGECSRFDTAVAELYDNVEKLANDAEEYEKEWYDQVLDEIRTIRDDRAYWEDPDQWEDMDFWPESEAMCFYVTES